MAHLHEEGGATMGVDPHVIEKAMTMQEKVRPPDPPAHGISDGVPERVHTGHIPRDAQN